MSVPMQQMPPMGAPQGPPQGQPEPEMQVNQLSEADEQDADIAFARAVEFLQAPSEDGPNGIEVLPKLLSGRNPEQQFAMFWTNMIEAIMTEAQEAGLDLNPVIWFADGGVIDRVADKIEDLLEGEFDVLGMMDAVKDQIRTMLGQRGEELKAQMESGQGPPQGQQGPPQAPVDDRPPLLARG